MNSQQQNKVVFYLKQLKEETSEENKKQNERKSKIKRKKERELRFVAGKLPQQSEDGNGHESPYIFHFQCF